MKASETPTGDQATVVQPTKTMPDALVIMWFVLLFAGVLTHIVPAGFFETSVDPSSGKTVLVAGSYQQAEQFIGVPLFAEGGNIGVLNALFEGLVSGSKYGSAIGVMAFILLTGAAFGVLMASGAINNGVLWLIQRAQRAQQLFIPSLFILFSLGGAVVGMGEEAIAFCIVLLPLFRQLGYHPMTTVLVTYVATQIGFAASWMNPFSVAIAQGIADVPLLSGAELRAASWFVLTSVGLVFTLKFAKQTRTQHVEQQYSEATSPENSTTHSSTAHSSAKHSSTVTPASTTLEKVKFDVVDGLILLSFFAGIGWITWGVLARGYYIPELSSQFFTLGIVVAAICVFGKRLTVNESAEAFKQGAKDLLPAALIVAMAKGVILLLGGDNPNQPSVLNTLLYVAGDYIADFPEVLCALAMFVFQSVFNFFVASGSGQAALTMPIMAPLADLVGVSRQIAVLAFQFGDGLTNIIIPTSASLIGCLGVAGVNWADWAKAMWRFVLLLMLTAAVFMIVAVVIGYA